ncbi:hypothetical protein GAGA_0007 [Paraglaciecola agarilytica NO2]|uniref:Uncharacterized protein n=1 Tax=Paraglaciecola agarilytica NO2 TaxID=1125747 RepID=A0ABQ0I0M9_9ALTE|nr:hypothetical protein GAGA_0007 [Paraglaciecola agarilytica NO2]
MSRVKINSIDFVARAFASLIYVLSKRYALRTPSTASLRTHFVHQHPCWV